MGSTTHLAYDYPLLGAFWMMLLLFLWITWFVLLFRVVTDLFRDDALSGWAKAGWLVLVVALPFVGVFAYLVARGRTMGRREIAQTRARQEAFDRYVRETAAGSGRGTGQGGTADELHRLSEIRSRGDLTDEEFDRAKELVLSGHGAGHTR
ncbi:SHOCT domain-containing protein [Streptomyces prasinus]